MTPTVLILRGLPGAGKSTYARKRADQFLAEHNLTGLVSICNADQYPGLYNADMEIDFSKMSDAHDWCFATFCEACEFAYASNHLIIVDNTNTTLSEMAPYRMVARRHKLDVKFVHVESRLVAEDLAARTIHNVPARNIATMRERWETLPTYWEEEHIYPVY